MSQIQIKEGDRERTYSFSGEDVTIGRHASNDIQLENPKVSRYHAAILQCEEGGYLIRDLGSKNHTRLNGKNISREPLSEGDRIEIGGAVLDYSEEAAKTRKRTRVRIVRPESREAGRKEDDVTTDIQTMVTRIDSVPEMPVDEAELKESHRRLSKLYQLGKTICSILDYHELLERILRIVTDTVGAERGFIALIDPRTEEITYEAVRAPDPDVARKGIQVSQVIIGRVLEKSESLLVADCQAEEHFRGFSSTSGDKITSLLCVPLREKGSTLGFLYLDSTDPGKKFTPPDLDFLSALSGQAAVAIQNAVLHQKICQGYTALEERMRQHGKIVGRSPKMRALFREVEKVAQVDATVMILGESGTGKELVASAVHYQSIRAKGSFIKVNCAAIPDTLLESELFGYAPRSGIAGADPRGKSGKFELAHGGSIFLDEIGDMNFTTQAKMLRVLQEKEVDRLGATEPVKVDVRIIAATNQDIEKAIQEGNFREDLYHRLKVVQLRVPPLRQRKEDIPLLANFFLDKHARHFGKSTHQISFKAMSLLMNHDWSSNNVRELENAIASAIVMGGGDVIMPEDLPLEVREEAQRASGAFQTLAQAEKQHIVRALQHTGANISEAASILGINRGTLYNKIKEYEISPEQYKAETAET